VSIEVRPYTIQHEAEWDSFCQNAVNATFLHTRRFLSYHGDRLKDMSLMLTTAGKLEGLFPAAESPSDSSLVVSHPGITYGGLIHNGRLNGMKTIDSLHAVLAHYKKLGYLRLQYKVVPYIYTKCPAQDDIYALFRLNANRVRCDISSTIDLENPRVSSDRRKRALKKAQKSVTLSADHGLLGSLWPVIADNLSRKYEASPVHSVEQLYLLRNRFPDQIVIRSALMDDKVEAGVIFFNSPTVWHAQYIAASERAYAVSALDAVFTAALTEARESGARYFDFGTSNEQAGRALNDGLYTFKSEFGGGGVAHEYYEFDLEKV
jgi:hypothetical protein